MALDQVLGAALSTAGGVLVGVFLFWWRSRAEELEELRQWYAKTERLAERVINAQGTQSAEFDELGRASYLRNTCAGVHTSLANHLAEAPPSVVSDVVVASEKLVEDCQTVKDVEPVMGTEAIPEPRIIEMASEAADQAELVVEKSEAARKNIGFSN